MNILIAGGTGLIGGALVRSFLPKHSVTVLGRRLEHVTQVFGNTVTGATWDGMGRLEASSFDVVINLAGHNIAAARWTAKTKQLIIDSRVNTNARLIHWLQEARAKPHFYCANAVGIYGLQTHGDQDALDEDSAIDFAHPKDFLSEVGVLWQESLQPAINLGIPVTMTRFGVVLKKGKGMLGKVGPSFQFGLGSVIGDGAQMLSWVHIEDVVRAYHFLIERPHLQGPFNVTSPNPVSQRTFANTLAKAMHRPLFLKTPAFIIRWLLGEMGECLINQGQKVVPKRLMEAGFVFQYSTIGSALEREYSLGS